MNLLPALTLIRPMDEALISDEIGKDAENREWLTRETRGLRTRAERLAGRWVAVHSGLKWWDVYHRHIRKLTGVDVQPSDTSPGHVVGLIRVRRAVISSQSRWAVNDGEHLILEVSQRFRLPEPVQCPGRQGLWLLPSDVNALVQQQAARAGLVLG